MCAGEVAQVLKNAHRCGLLPPYHVQNAGTHGSLI
jgi:hypothetical protein